MHVRCPHCQNPIELADEQSLAEISCPSCGSNFSLIEGQSTATTAWAPIQHIGHFELVEQLGVGAFGSVWKARDKELDRLVAVKIPRKSQLDPNEIEQFLREARAAAQLHHPNIVSVHEVGRDADTVYIVSDLVQGVTLVDWLSGQRPTPRESAQLCLQLAKALEHAHQKGVIHRDIKPGNIMLNADGHVFLMDFGLAKREAGEITMTYEGRVLGTPAYMSPEQARGESHRVDRRTDIYSLGAVLFQLLTGELPFHGTPRMLLHQVLNDEPRSPRALNDRLPRDLETICLKAMAKEPTRRYQTAGELAHDLTCFLSGQPISARPVGRIERSWRWCRRNPLVTGLSGGIALVLIFGTVVSTYFAATAIVQKNLAEEKADEALASARSATEAKAKATEEARRANTEAEKATRVARFLASMFEASAPSQHFGIRFTGRGRRGLNNPTDPMPPVARELVDRGSRKVVEELKDQPEIQAALMDTLGNVYIGLGLIDEAEPLLTTALEIRRGLSAESNLETATSLFSLSALRSLQFETLMAAEAAREAWVIRQRLLGPDHKDVVDAKFMLAMGLTMGSNRDGVTEGTQLLREVLAWRREHLGADSQETVFGMLLLAEALRQSGQADKVAPLLAEAMVALKKNPETKLLGLALTEAMQAQVLLSLKQFDTAVVQSGRAVDHFMEFEGDDHPLFAPMADMRLICLRSAGRWDEVKQFCRDRLERLDKNRGPVWEVCATHLVGAQLHRGLRNERDEATKFCQEWMRRSRERGRTPTPALVVALAQMFNALLTTGDPNDLNEAEKLYQDCLLAEHQLNVFQVQQLVEVMRNIAAPLERQDPVRAEALYRQALTMTREALLRQKATKRDGKVDADAYARTVLLFASMLRANKRTEEAEALYRESLPLTLQHNDEYFTMLVTNGLAELHLENGKSAEAERLYRQSLQVAEKLRLVKPEPAGSIAISITHALVNCLVAQGKSVDVEQLYAELIRINPRSSAVHNEIAWSRAPNSSSLWNTLGVAQYRAGNWADAIASLTKAEDIALPKQLAFVGTSKHLAFNGFFLAMAHWQLDHKDEARAWYDRSVTWMEKNQPKNEDLIRFRAEAEQLLGITQPIPPPKDAPQGDSAKPKS